MIIFNLDFLNTMLSVLGMAGWVWIWSLKEYKTGRTIRTQVSMIVFGVIWVMLFTADTAQDLKPTSLTVLSRAFLLFALWGCMPLLKHCHAETNKEEVIKNDRQYSK